jgi:hypothetical protein
MSDRAATRDTLPASDAPKLPESTSEAKAPLTQLKHSVQVFRLPAGQAVHCAAAGVSGINK